MDSSLWRSAPLEHPRPLNRFRVLFRLPSVHGFLCPLLHLTPLCCASLELCIAYVSGERVCDSERALAASNWWLLWRRAPPRGRPSRGHARTLIKLLPSPIPPTFRPRIVLCAFSYLSPLLFCIRSEQLVAALKKRASASARVSCTRAF